MTTALKVRVAARRSPLVARTVEILRRHVRERSRIPVEETGANEADLELAIRPGIGKEGFVIEDGDHGAVRIAGNDERGILYGVGKFLRTSRFAEREFTPGEWRGKSVPRCAVRGMYFATHFFNVYHVAPVEVIQRYVEDLALWGCNALWVWFDMHHYTGIGDPQAREMIARLRILLQTANATGMQGGLTSGSNEAYSSSPEALRSTCYGAYGVELCPSKPGAMELMLRWREEVFEAFSDIEMGSIATGPYDQGGCECDQCAPWGVNGYLRMAKEISRLARRHFPNAKMIVGTWCFDMFPKPIGEWDGLYKVFKERPAWIDYLAVDAPEEFPGHPLKYGLPGNLPMLTFPEISMYKMYPWGGFGANPLPSRLQKRWDQTKRLVAGGFPYSEGIYEDINKAITLQLYWDANKKTADIVREYAAYEFAPDAADDCARAIKLMEQNHYRHWELPTGATEPVAMMKDPPAAQQCFEIVSRVQARLSSSAKASWRWRIFRLRSALDVELAATGGKANVKVNAYLDELTQIYGMSPRARHAPARKTLFDACGAELGV